MSVATDTATTIEATSDATRWRQIVLDVICMVAAANIQYAWTLFVPEIQKEFGWQRAAIQTAFPVFVIVQTWLTPLEGYLIDKYGPRLMVFFGAWRRYRSRPFSTAS